MAAKRARSAKSRGGLLVDAVTKEYELDQHELELLNQAARSLDLFAELEETVDRDGAMIRKDFEGPLRPHPALPEMRAQAALYQRLIRQLALPTGLQSEAPDARGQSSTVRRLRSVDGAWRLGGA